MRRRQFASELIERSHVPFARGRKALQLDANRRRQLRRDIALTQFEFSTLAIVRLLSMLPLDLLILEVGLGGRYDSVNAFDTDCAVITSIDLDHMEWLGPDRERIGLEKAQIMRPGVPASLV